MDGSRSISENRVTASSSTDSVSRLGRAAELAEYLRQNPKETKGDPEDLGDRFGLSAALVSQIQSNVNSRSTKDPVDRVKFTDRLRAIWKVLLKIVERLVSQPYIFQTVAAFATGIAAFAPHGGAESAFLVWCVFQVWCLFTVPRFRYVAFGSVFVAGIAGVMFVDVVRSQKSGIPLPVGVISTVFGIAMGVLNLMLGGVLVVLGGSIQIAARRRKSATLSRQDLVVRMFELQQQLEFLPETAPKKVHPWVAFARQRPILTAAVLTFVLASIQHANALFFHVDPFAIQQAQEIQNTHSTKSGMVIITPGVKSGTFLTFESLIGLMQTAVRIGFGFLANSWRKVWFILAGMFLGFVLAILWAGPAGALGSMPTALAATYPLQEALSGLLLMAIVRFAVGFNRALATFRAGAVPDEASIVGELLEIRHRLSAQPATICVLVVDAAGSTQMKKMADQLSVEYSFGRYQNWIGKIVTGHGGKVEIRTGDGAICAFGSAEFALAAAQQIQTDIGNFNQAENKLELPFRLRVALHAGLVQADLEKVQFTEVIDVAAHTEKHSPIGGIALTEAFIQALPKPPTLPICATVDGFEVCAMTV